RATPRASSPWKCRWDRPSRCSRARSPWNARARRCSASRASSPPRSSTWGGSSERSLRLDGAGAARAARERVLLPLQVAEDGARIDAEIARRLRAVAVVALQDLEDVAPLKVFLGLLQGDDRSLRFGAEIQILGPEERLVAKDEGLLDAVLELPDVAGPVEL